MQEPKISSVLGGSLPDWMIGVVGTPLYDKNQLTPTPNQTAPFNAGYTQGFTGVSLKGHHTEQFLLGYINGTKDLKYDKASVFGYLHMPFHADKATMIHWYNEGKWNRGYVDCNAQEPIGTLPAHTNDNYMQFWIGYNNGAMLRLYSDPSGNYPHFGDCPSNQTAEFCTGWHFGWNYNEAEINPPSPANCPENGIKG